MKTILSAILICIVINCHGQTLLEKANQSFINQEWSQSAKLFESYLEDNEEDSAAWYRLGVSQMNLDLLDESIVSLKKAKKFEFNGNIIAYNLAKVYLKKGDLDKMYQTLETAAQENGLANFSTVKSDSDFSNHQKEDRFQAILSKVEENAYPCLTNTDARHFDFWIGEWDVFAQGTKAGINIISRAKGGCAIHESYTTRGNYAGQSINFFSPVDQKWHQHWVGSAGDVFNYVETKRAEGLLQFQSEFLNGQGDVALSRLTFTLNEDGTVRQLFENSSDDGTTWTPAFDGLYKKRKQ